MSVSCARDAFGLSVFSDVPLPALSPARGKSARAVDVHLSQGCLPEVGGLDAPPDDVFGYERLWRLEDGGWLLRYESPLCDGVWAMRVAPGGVRIDVERTAGIPLEDIIQILLTAGLAAALQLAGILLLHGCVIEVDGRAVVVLGVSGAGKSTVALACGTAGHALLSDDIAAIEIVDGDLVVHAGLTSLRISPAAATAVGWDPLRLPRVFRTPVFGDKRNVELSGQPGLFCAEARRIAAVYVLAPRREAEPGVLPEVSVLTAREALTALLTNGYRTARLDHSQRAAQLTLLARIAQDVPMCGVHAADDLAALPLLVDALTRTPLPDVRAEAASAA